MRPIAGRRKKEGRIYAWGGPEESVPTGEGGTATYTPSYPTRLNHSAVIPVSNPTGQGLLKNPSSVRADPLPPAREGFVRKTAPHLA